jgi:hypothetical protein
MLLGLLNINMQRNDLGLPLYTRIDFLRVVNLNVRPEAAFLEETEEINLHVYKWAKTLLVTAPKHK